MWKHALRVRKGGGMVKEELGRKQSVNKSEKGEKKGKTRVMTRLGTKGE
jgi:hypothetical protein